MFWLMRRRPHCWCPSLSVCRSGKIHLVPADLLDGGVHVAAGDEVAGERGQDGGRRRVPRAVLPRPPPQRRRRRRGRLHLPPRRQQGRKHHFPFLTADHGGGAAAASPLFGCQPFTITPSSESRSSSSSRHSNGKMFAHDGGLDNCALSLLSDNPTPTAQITIPQPLVAGGGQYGGGGGGDVSLTGLSYVRMAGKDTSILAKSATTTATTATTPTTTSAQLQYHGYYHHHVSADQGSSDAAIQALPFSSW